MSDDISINSESIKRVVAAICLCGSGMLYDIKDHCKRSCTAEHCNNCALRKYTEEKMKTYDDVIRELKSNFPKTKEYDAGLSFVSLIKHHLCDFGIMIANAVAESYLDDMHLYCDDWCQNPGACPPSCPLYKYIGVEVRK